MNWIRKILLKRLLKMGVFSLPQKGILYIEDLSQKELDDFAKDIQTFFEGEKPEPLLILVNKKVEVYSLKEIMKKEPILHAVDKEGWYLCNKACGITTKKVAKLQGKPVTCKNCLNILKKEVKK